jgi:LysM repeat protein
MKLLKSACYLLFFLSINTTFGQQANRAFRDLQQEVEDLRQKVHCYELERDILEEKIHKQETLLTKLQKDLTQSQNSKEELNQNKLSQLEKKLAAIEQKNESLLADLKQLQNHANTTTTSLTTFKTKVGDLEDSLNSDVTNLKGAVESLVKAIHKGASDGIIDGKNGLKVYKVKAGDSLEKIAKNYGIKVEQLKKLNNLTKDRIIVGQELVLGD